MFHCGALVDRVLAAAVTTTLAREEGLTCPFLEPIKAALHAIKHASAPRVGFKSGTSEHSAVNLCSQSLRHMKRTNSHITQVC